MVIVRELQAYYRANGILATHFTCKHKDECSHGHCDFVGPKFAFVGSNYEQCHDAGLPRVVFVSLDPGKASPVVEDRLADRVREGGEKYGHCSPKNTHWYRTFELAHCLLGKFDGAITIESVGPYFAHANSAKCCQNKGRAEKADRHLFDNCREFTRRELSILEPDIVVSQGWEAYWAVAASRDGDTETRIEDDALHLVRVQIGGRSVLWLKMYHPRSGRKGDRLAKFGQKDEYAERIFRCLGRRGF